jgi:hypothetical protein
MASIIDQPAGPIIKSDRTGRTRYTRQYKQEVLTAFQSSSLSAPAFARQCGIRYSTFAAWVAKRRQPCRHPALELFRSIGARDAIPLAKMPEVLC